MRRGPSTTNAKAIFKFIMGLLWVTIALLICWSVAFFLTSSLGLHLSPLLLQLLNSLLGFFLFGLLMYILSKFVSKRQRVFYQSITEALRRIAKGDFQVMIQLPERFDEGPMNHLIHSINDMAADLGKLESMRQDFISDVSHEIQSPLTSISGFARVLKEEGLSPEMRNHYLEIIEKESVRLSKLSENMLRLASLDSEQHPFYPVPMRLDKQIQTMILACEPQWLDKDLEMIVDLQQTNIEADPDLLSQVWVNLLHNAIKFTPVKGTIQVFLEANDEEAIVRIEDTGIGISAEDQEHIFERFYKADKSRTHASGGSGLGLSIIEKIVKMHGGNVSVTSSLGKGTTFTVWLPLVAVPEHDRVLPSF
ncbi:HAMP domain-containing sensor histidine kinase [Paenibacillus sp. Marseille-Q4541]|uniref:sensor histidine kinase n=1 Tax=Paenibacillus sp. Marseille-Q4541 TaxID=2831522 RepID=UPI001BA538FD|nr:HAMP domain-containing sensor histidine kinase [Paenibacillus sp. Marseille-Q4541]